MLYLILKLLFSCGAGAVLIIWSFKYALRNKPRIKREKFNDEGTLIEREEFYR